MEIDEQITGNSCLFLYFFGLVSGTDNLLRIFILQRTTRNFSSYRSLSKTKKMENLIIIKITNKMTKKMEITNKKMEITNKKNFISRNKTNIAKCDQKTTKKEETKRRIRNNEEKNKYQQNRNKINIVEKRNYRQIEKIKTDQKNKIKPKNQKIKSQKKSKKLIFNIFYANIFEKRKIIYKKEKIFLFHKIVYGSCHFFFKKHNLEKNEKKFSEFKVKELDTLVRFSFFKEVKLFDLLRVK